MRRHPILSPLPEEPFGVDATWNAQGLLSRLVPHAAPELEPREAEIARVGGDIERIEGEVADMKSNVERLTEQIEFISIMTDASAARRWGADAWAKTYAKGHDAAFARRYASEYTEEMLREDGGIGATPIDDDGSPFQDRLAGYLAWSAAWARDAFPTVETSHTYAAALMCTDVYPEAVAGLRAPWRAFKVIVPPGMITLGDAEKFEVAHLTVEVEDGGAACVLMVTRSGFTMFPIAGASLEAALSLDPPHAEHEVVGRAERLVQRLVAGLVLAMHDRSRTREREHPAKRSGTRSEPRHRHVVVGQPIKVDARGEVAAYLAGNRAQHGPAAFQWLVRGHWRRQAHGPKRGQRKTIWIMPFWKGAEDAPILASPRRVE